MEKTELINLVTRAKSGDSDAMGKLYEEFYNSVYYFAKKTVKDDDLAQDITQETFIEVIRTIGALKAPEAFSTWLRQITYHQCTKYFRKNREVLIEEDEEGNSVLDTMADESEDSIPAEVYEKAEFRETILSMVDKLTEEQRAVVVLYYYDELSVKRIAEIQGVSEGTVKSRLNYARKALRSSVESYEEKTGIKLHAIPFLPLIRLFLDEPASLSASEAEAIGKAVAAAGGAAATAAATSAAASTATATAATVSATATAATTATVAATTAATVPLAAKITAVALAAAIAVGAGTAIAKNSNDNHIGASNATVESTESTEIYTDIGADSDALTHDSELFTESEAIPSDSDSDTEATDSTETTENNVSDTTQPSGGGMACLTVHQKPTVSIEARSDTVQQNYSVTYAVLVVTSNSTTIYDPMESAGHGFFIYVDGKLFTKSSFYASPTYTFEHFSSYVWETGVHEIKIVPTCIFIGTDVNHHDQTIEDLTVTLTYDLTSNVCPLCRGTAKYIPENNKEHYHQCTECMFRYGKSTHSFTNSICSECDLKVCANCGGSLRFTFTDSGHGAGCSNCNTFTDLQPHDMTPETLIGPNEYSSHCKVCNYAISWKE